MCGPFEPAFDSLNDMVIGFNPYVGGPRFPMIYHNILDYPEPVSALGDLFSMPTSNRFDAFGNLYILDHNRSRVLIYQNKLVRTYKVSGTITTASGVPVPEVKVHTLGYASSSLTDDAGVYTLTGLITGTYTIIASKPPYRFLPFTRTIVVPADTGKGLDFTAVANEVFLPVAAKSW